MLFVSTLFVPRILFQVPSTSGTINRRSNLLCAGVVTKCQEDSVYAYCSFSLYTVKAMTLGTLRSDNDDVCSDEIHSCLRTFISNTVRTATILNRDNTRRQCFKQYSRQCVETDQFWSLLRVNCQAANTRSNVSKGKLKNKVT